MKTIDISNGISINADLFIIPNSASKIEDLLDFVRDENLKRMQNICELNNMSFNPEKDYLIETWYCSPELECDNIADHSIHVMTQNGEDCIIGVESHYLPSNLFIGKKEGDVIKVKLPVWVRTGSRKNAATDMVADFSITLAQQKYRYRRFGAFEECFNRVIAAQRL